MMKQPLSELRPKCFGQAELCCQWQERQMGWEMKLNELKRKTGTVEPVNTDIQKTATG